MFALTIVFYIVVACYALILAFEARETRGRFTNTPRRAVWTVYLFFLTDMLIIIGGLVEYHINGETNLVVSAAGFSLLTAKILLKRWAMNSLGKHYNVNILVVNSHKLVQSGPYKYVRHPAYLARIFSTVGIPLMLNSYFILVLAMIVDLTFILVRIKLEEQELTDHFGDRYVSYRKYTWALIPFKSLLTRR